MIRRRKRRLGASPFQYGTPKDEIYQVSSNILADVKTIPDLVRRVYDISLEVEDHEAGDLLESLDNAAINLKKVIQELRMLATM